MKKDQSLEVVFTSDGIAAEKLWQLIRSVIRMEGIEEPSYQIVDRIIPTDEIGPALRIRKHFGILGNAYSFDYCPVEQFDHCLLTVQSLKECERRDWDMWVATLGSLDSFINARIYDVEYEFWQNAQDVSEYESNGRSYESLPIVSNGLPFPLTKQIIDISRNPGRRILRRGFVEGVGSTMWIGPNFIKRTKARLQKLRASQFYQVTPLHENLFKIKVQEACFDCGEGKQALLQNQLRELLYPGV
jgi:hypothetical protein